jgi:putative N6-adenine-specific DNA methylase
VSKAGQDDASALNLERRIKRHVWAPVHDFFAVTAPGLEELCAAELRALGLPIMEPQPGGVPFQERWEAAYLANLCLRTAGRVLVRLKDYRVRTWADLTRQAAAVPWEVWLPPGATLKVQVTLRESNLKHEGRVGEELFAAAVTHMESLGLEPPVLAEPGQPGLALMARGQDRRASFSLDTSGEHLHRRGYRLDPGQAPLREDLAAALLMLCGYTGQEPLLDPFCGAGTLAIEAALMARRIPPGIERRFACEDWPCHRAAAFAHLKKRALERSSPQAPAPIHARDLAPKAVKTTLANAHQAGVHSDIQTAKADFFTAPAPEKGPGLVVINPPFGKRLGSVRQAAEIAARIGQRLRQAYPGWRCGVVLYRPEWEQDLGLIEPRRLVVPHGGLTVTLLAGRVPENTEETG